jgi:hypothetical protein
VVLTSCTRLSTLFCSCQITCNAAFATDLLSSKLGFGAVFKRTAAGHKHGCAKGQPDAPHGTRICTMCGQETPNSTTQLLCQKIYSACLILRIITTFSFSKSSSP